MLPFAPLRFSTTTGWPSVSESLWPTTRAAMSGAPPGGIRTMMVIGREGNWASAPVDAKNRARRKARNFMPETRKKVTVESGRTRKAARVGNFLAIHLTKLFCGERRDGDGFSIERGELDFESRAIAVHEHHRAHISALKSMLRKIAFEDYIVQFADHG